MGPKKLPGYKRRMAYLRAKLLERRRELLRNLHGELSATRAVAHPGDISDAAIDARDRDMASYLAELEAIEVGQIDEALGKIEQGTYGFCEECGVSISLSRLKALPFASLCLKCKQKHEAEDSARKRGLSRWGEMKEESGDFFDPELAYEVVRGRKIG